MKIKAVDLEKYASLAREVAAEGCVLLANQNKALPLQKEEKISIFGVNAFYYYKSGLGSGGLVNTKYVVSILDALKKEEVALNEELLNVYEKWIDENPFDEGHGWGTVPWSQKEMPVSEELVAKAAATTDTAIVMIGRTAGEDQDNSDTRGSYRLTEIEEQMLKTVTAQFKKTIVLLNVGNIVDMSFMDSYSPAAVMYVWQGGQEGGNGVCDVLMGRVSPSGKLTDTIAKAIGDYPSTPYFGDVKENIYVEDIYVGYRYFETLAKDKVVFPFGYGMSYTTFSCEKQKLTVEGDKLTASVEVSNTGDFKGKEVIQVYVEAPQGALGKPARVLVGFAKTKELCPGEKEVVSVSFTKDRFASFDDTGVTGHPFCFVLEAGEYQAFIGTSVRDAVLCGTWKEADQVLEVLESACGPRKEIERFKITKENGDYVKQMEVLQPSKDYTEDRIKADRTKDITYTGNKGYVLKDVYEKKVSMDAFLAQISDEQLACITRGEGMCSSKVTAGTASAMAGLTQDLQDLGIPAGCCADGPSGIRMDCGSIAFSLPNGTLIGCTFNLPLARELYEMMGREIAYNNVDTILGPGMNIHRHPLNGRNFEYYSEDPFVTGQFAVAMLQGLHESHVTGTCKHFATNNQEVSRNKADAIVSERALREIYLKGFEMTVREGNARSIMTTYGCLNGLWTAGSFDLCTTILRKQWGFKGIVMSDWWAVANELGKEPEEKNHASMVLAQNDLFMVCPDTLKENELDNVLPAFKAGIITRHELLKCAENVCDFMLQSPAFLRQIGVLEPSTIEEDRAREAKESGEADVIFYQIDADTHQVEVDFSVYPKDGSGEIKFGLKNNVNGECVMDLFIKSETGELAQIPVTVYMDNIFRATVSFRGTNGEIASKTEALGYMLGDTHYMKFKYKETSCDIVKAVFHENAAEREI